MSLRAMLRKDLEHVHRPSDFGVVVVLGRQRATGMFTRAPLLTTDESGGGARGQVLALRIVTGALRDVAQGEPLTIDEGSGPVTYTVADAYPIDSGVRTEILLTTGGA